MADVGLILTDVSLEPIALNPEAAMMLGDPDWASIKRRLISGVNKQALEQIRRPNCTKPSSLVTTFGTRGTEYLCRFYLVDAHSDRLPSPILVLLIQRSLPDNQDN